MTPDDLERLIARFRVLYTREPPQEWGFAQEDILAVLDAAQRSIALAQFYKDARAVVDGFCTDLAPIEALRELRVGHNNLCVAVQQGDAAQAELAALKADLAAANLYGKTYEQHYTALKAEVERLRAKAGPAQEVLLAATDLRAYAHSGTDEEELRMRRDELYAAVERYDAALRGEGGA